MISSRRDALLADLKHRLVRGAEFLLVGGSLVLCGMVVAEYVNDYRTIGWSGIVRESGLVMRRTVKVQAWDGTFNAYTAKLAFSLRIKRGVVKLTAINPMTREDAFDCAGELERWSADPRITMQVDMSCDPGPSQLSPTLTYVKGEDVWYLQQRVGGVVSRAIPLSRTAREAAM